MTAGWLRAIKTGARRRHGIVPLSAAIAALESWLDSPFGRALMEREQASVDRALNCLFGYHLMQLSISRRLDLSAASTINHRFALTPGDLNDDSRIQGRAELDSLPLPAESIDVVLLHHVLEYSQRPHQLLREASRVIIPRGHMVILGFNPWSVMGMCKPFAQLLNRKQHWRYHSLRLGRLLDWLRLLDFEPISVEHGFYRPPLARASFLDRLGWMERLGHATNFPGGAYYCVVARKEIAAMTPIRPVWSNVNPIVRLTAGKPSSSVLTQSVDETAPADVTHRQPQSGSRKSTVAQHSRTS
ncbi:class I SAM-dependent methyltransferase [Exilibacterium tricleocarpae]|uniref:Class I SAM-dependent methyltransferase n=1 Tax=Exilibacterium tricleocarpae TaxID=2591008 RepID=A0A545TVP5_9GAMM|nr:class I SAM-dependent methyltransferase [Exilibacterium tricleocarpae]TQV81298.1 class I SAM-dependent methyltransferase [Exilibacterium tricleocarpae]